MLPPKLSRHFYLCVQESTRCTWAYGVHLELYKQGIFIWFLCLGSGLSQEVQELGSSIGPVWESKVIYSLVPRAIVTLSCTSGHSAELES